MAARKRRKRRNPETGWRSYGPGKFDSMVDSFLWDMSLEGWVDEEAGDVQTTGYYALFVGDVLDMATTGASGQGEILTDVERDELRGTKAIILSEDDQGVEYFDSAKAARKKWKEIESEVAEAEGMEEGD